MFGPETGVLNIVLHETFTNKIILLSHSFPVNLEASQPNATTLVSYGVDCYPCHKLHYNWKTCRRDEAVGGSVCAVSILADRALDAVSDRIGQKKRKAA